MKNKIVFNKHKDYFLYNKTYYKRRGINILRKVIFEYDILTPCHYTCAMEVHADYLTSRTIARHFEIFYQPGHTYPMMCNSSGCRAGANYCETVQSHDEL